MNMLVSMATRRPVAVSVVAAALVILGWTAWSDLPLDLLPDLKSPTVVISIRSGDRPPAEMERIYGEQIEQRLFAVRGIRDVDQVARTGRLIASVTFDWDVEMDIALVEVEKAVGPIRSDFEVGEVVVRRFDPRQVPVLTLGLVPTENGPPLAELRRIARRQVATALERLAGVGEARVTGGREKEIRVDVDPFKLEAHGLSLAEVESRLRQANVDINAGTLEEGGKVFLVRGLSRYRTPEDITRVVVRYRQDESRRTVPVRISDVATVVLTDREITHLVRVNGREGVGLAIYKEAGSNTVNVSRTVRAALEGLSADLPGVDVLPIVDEATLVEDAINDVEQAALIGILLAILVLVVFLRAAGPTVIVALVVPVSLLATLFMMHFGGQSLNLMTLGGLALGAGMLVDNAIVVVESIFKRLSGTDDPTTAVIRGTTDVAGAIAASTLTTCAVFLPVLFIKGLAARLVSGLAFSVVISLLISLVVALLLIPALAGWFLPRGKTRAIDPGKGRFERFMGRVLRRPLMVVFAAVILAVLAIQLLGGLGTELLPPSDPRQFSVRLVTPPGTQVEATARTVAVVEEILTQVAGDDLEAIFSEIGRLPEDDRFIREEQTEENTARIMVRLAPGGRSGGEVVAAAAPAVATLASVEASWEVGVSALARALGTTGPPVVVEINGRALEDLRSGAELIQARFAGINELWNARSSFEGGPPELRVVLDRGLADGLGIDLDTVTAALQASLDGRRVTIMSTGDEEREISLFLPAVRREELLAVPLRTQSGVRVVVGDVARLVPVVGAREIFRRDQRRVARVTARIASGSDYPHALEAAHAALSEIELPPGLNARLVGEEAERAATFEQLGWAAGLAVLLVFMVLAGKFESLIQPVTVITAIPLALIGVAAILVPLGQPIGVMEMLGMIVLAGVAVNDAILLMEYARQRIHEGVPVAEALAAAAAARLRPIMMTSATTVLALLPLAVMISDSADLRRPLALTVIGGLVASTVFSLTVIPCIYLLFDRLRPRRRLPS
jgi:HAE1 family hydrophobic/amphiphilic exporter-1